MTCNGTFRVPDSICFAKKNKLVEPALELADLVAHVSWVQIVTGALDGRMPIDEPRYDHPFSVLFSQDRIMPAIAS